MWAAWLVLAACGPLPGEVITLRSGFQLEGQLTKIDTLDRNPLSPRTPTGQVAVSRILCLDDGLRRSYASVYQVRADGLAAGRQLSLERIRIPKRIATGGRRIANAGPFIRVEPWDEYGNRLVSLNAGNGVIHVVQGITEVTPVYTKVEGLLVRNPIVWDMRVATSSIPREVLDRVFRLALPQDDPHERLRPVSLYIQAGRYRDALVVLEQVIKDFPDFKDLPRQRRRLVQLLAEDVIREIRHRREAGQHRRVYALLKNFPSDGVAGELLVAVDDMLKEYDRTFEQGKRVVELLDEHLGQLAGHPDAALLNRVVQEIKTELSFDTLNRMADYLRLADSQELKVPQKLALAISGWLTGSGAGVTNLPEALSLVRVRDLVRAYLRSHSAVDREAILQELRSLEGGTPEPVARILAHMKPPEDPPQVPEHFDRTLEITLPDHAGVSGSYTVFIPPEYEFNVYRRYPCVVTLHGLGGSPKGQIEWWAGEYDGRTGFRTGQADRHGYFVIAPRWMNEQQRGYEYSAREHAVVLAALRDACRRFSIDTDRVFLSGHFTGADAAWDIALAHPDLWAGVVLVVPTAGKYVTYYWRNAQGLPLYIVGGQLDGRLEHNVRELDRYLTRTQFDTIFVEYLGRGYEHYHDEIQRIFDWMQRYRRDFFRKEFDCVTMRPWDNFFWWAELDGFPPRAVTLPLDWPPERRNTTGGCEGRIGANNNIRVRTIADRVTVWLAPQLVDFDRPILVNGDRVAVEPSVPVMLEDVRTRADRFNPFWAAFQLGVPRR